MNHEIVIHAFYGLITLSLFMVFFYWRWQLYVTDVTRQRLFELRDQLFDYALDHEQFKASHASKDIRELLNSMIRFAHEIDVAHVFLQGAFIYFGRKQFIVKKAAASVEELLNSVPDPDKQFVRKVVQDAHFVICWHFFRRSLLLILLSALLIPIVLLVTILFASTNNLVKVTNRKFGRLINAMAYEENRSSLGDASIAMGFNINC